MSVAEVLGIIAVCFIVVGIPMVGLVTRFALRPLVKDIADAIQASSGQGDADVRGRLAAIEERMDDLRSDLEQLSEAETFHRELQSGEGAEGT